MISTDTLLVIKLFSLLPVSLKSVRSSDLIIRYGGDEFIIFLEYVEFGAVLKVVEKFVLKSSRPILSLKMVTQFLFQ